MKIVVDIGNTRTKVALFKNEGLVQSFVFANQLDKKQIGEIKSWSAEVGIISSVAENEGFWKNTFPEIEWLTLSAKTNVPFQNNYATPNTLGKDRIALVAAAVTKYSGNNVLVIDAGTCVTYDFVDRNNVYLGGAISPGLYMRLNAMHSFTSKLPKVEVDLDVELIGNSTEECMQSGALHGLAAEINGTIASYKTKHEELIVVLTGGDTNLLAPLVKSGIFAHQNFLLEGLHDILAYNTP